MRAWASDTFLQLKVIREISQMEDDIKRRLKVKGLYKFITSRPFGLPRKKEEEAFDVDKPFYLKVETFPSISSIYIFATKLLMKISCIYSWRLLEHFIPIILSAAPKMHT